MRSVKTEKTLSSGSAKPETKFQSARRELVALAESLGPGAVFPSVRQLRLQLGVSSYTLDAVLTELEKQRIVQRRQGSGIYVAPEVGQRTLYLICSPTFLLDFGVSPIWNQLIAGVRRRAEEQGGNLSLHFTLPFERTDSPEPFRDASAFHHSLVDEIMGRRVQGVLSIGLSHSQTRWIEQFAIPVVAFAGPANYIVSLGTSEVIQVGVAALVRKGCRRIAYWSKSPLFGELEPIFRGALAAQGAEDYPGSVAVSPREGTPMENGWHLACAYFGPESDPNGRPDGIVSSDDMLTQGVLMGLQRFGIRPGVDIHIATHANTGSPTLLAWEDSITRIEFNPDAVVRTMFDTLEALIEGELPLVPPTLYGGPPEHTITIRPERVIPSGSAI